jgi:hypothetical protein
MKLDAQNWSRWKEKLSTFMLRGRVVTLFAARGDMRENGSMTDYQTDGLALLVLMMNFCVGLHVHRT